MNDLTPYGSFDPRGRSTIPLIETPPFHLLTDIEKECLRFVAQGYTSKRIAAERKVRRDTIDKLLRRARDKMGSETRGELARLLVEYERLQEARASDPETPGHPALPPPDFVGVQSVGLARVTEMPSSEAPETPNHGSGGVSSPRKVTRLVDLSDIDLLQRLLFGSHRSPRNDLDRWSKITVISVVTAGAALTAVALIPLLMVLDRIAAGL